MNDASLEMPDDLAAVIKIAGEAVKFPGENGIRLPALNAAKHVIEDRAPRPLCALAFGERVHNVQAFPPCNGFQSGNLCYNRENLAIFVLTGFATINEVFKHTNSIAKDKTNC